MICSRVLVIILWSLILVVQEGFGRDDGGTLRKAFDIIKEECNRLSTGMPKHPGIVLILF
jgi:hypothetical protein